MKRGTDVISPTWFYLKVHQRTRLYARDSSRGCHFVVAPCRPILQAASFRVRPQRVGCFSAFVPLFAARGTPSVWMVVERALRCLYFHGTP